MDRQQFDVFLAEARSRGFDHVITGGGAIPLDAWRPYGSFDGGNPGIEAHIPFFRWVGPDQAIDGDPGSLPEGLALGVWTFVNLTHCPECGGSQTVRLTAIGPGVCGNPFHGAGVFWAQGD